VPLRWFIFAVLVGVAMTVPDPSWSWRLGLHAQDLDADGHDTNLTASIGAFTDETQAVQSRRYLMQDGTFRDPLLVGDGVLSVGSITTVTDDTKYNAWPSIARMRANQILLGYTKGDSHHADNTGKAVGKIGLEGFGGVVTWGTEFTIYDDASDWVSLTGVAVLSTGRIIASLFQDHVGSGTPLDGAFVIYSDDEGATWGSRITVNSSLTSYSYGSGRVLELPNGDLLQAVEGKNSGDTFSRMVVLRSTDQGDTWGSQVTIATGTRDYYEACLGLLDDDMVLVLLRTSDASGDIYQSTSTDGGATWAAPSLAFAGHGQPNWTQLSTGTLIAVTRENDGSLQGDVWAYTSIDRGTTWSSATTLDGTMYEMEYGSPIELLDGRMLVVYGYQPSSATTNADVKQAYVTEGTTSSSTSFGTPAIVLGMAAAAGSAGTAVRTDATIVAFDATVPVTQAFGDSAATGSVAKAARRDHVHGMPAAPSGGAILIADTHSTPLIFADLIQNEAQDDLLYSDT
jgi:hypothetical protein